MEAEQKRPKTVKKYLTVVRAFERWLAADTWETVTGDVRMKVPRSLGDFQREDVELYVATRRSRTAGPAKARTKKSVLAAVRSFVRSQRRDLAVPLAEIKVRIPRPEARPMPRAFAEAMMRYFEEGSRNYLFLLFLFRTGMRIGEVLTLKISDLCKDAQGRPAESAGSATEVLTKFRIRDDESKTGHRPVVLFSEVVAALEHYLHGIGPESVYLFPGQQDELSYSRAYEVFSTTAKTVGAPRTNPHSARGFYITSMIEAAKEAGIPWDSVLPAICIQTGVSIQNLMHYVQPSEETIRDLMRISFEEK